MRTLPPLLISGVTNLLPDSNKAEQVETNERLRHAQRVASETHSRFTADFTEIKRVVSQQRSI